MGERNGGAIEKRILLSFSRKLSRYSQEGQFSRILLSNGSSLFRSVFVSRAPTKKARSLHPSLHRNCLPIEIKAQIYFNRCAVERKERPPPLIFPSLPPPFLDLHPLVLPWNIYSGNHEFLWFFVSSEAFNYYRENNVLRVFTIKKKKRGSRRRRRREKKKKKKGE